MKSVTCSADENVFTVTSYMLCQTRRDVSERLRKQQQQCQKSLDGNADSPTTRQRETGARIPDVWKNHGAGEQQALHSNQ